MRFEDIYAMGEALHRRALRVDLDLRDLDPYEVFKGRRRPRKPIQCIQSSASTPMDIVGTMHVYPNLVSDRLIQLNELDALLIEQVEDLFERRFLGFGGQSQAILTSEAGGGGPSERAR